MTEYYCIDANVFITAWHLDYKESVLPTLWAEIAKKKDQIIIIKNIYDEIEPISSADKRLTTTKKKEKYPLRIWLNDNGFTETIVNEDVIALSLELERKYEINDISKGACQNDITLIAYAKLSSNAVVTYESEQNQKPSKISNFKIPLICKEENVNCINFITMIEKLGIRI